MRSIEAVFFAAVLLWSTQGICQSQPQFLSASQIDAAVIIDPPPANDSEKTKSELAEVKRLVRNATPERMDLAKYDDRTEELTVFTEILGYEITETELPKTWKMLRDVRFEETVAVNYAKQLFKRPRPYELDRTIEHCSLAQPNTSYPSGHANYIYATATVLAALVPSKASPIYKRADEFGESRLICGMHFRSDVTAGKKLGTQVGASLLKNTAFKGEFDAAVAELTARSHAASSTNETSTHKAAAGTGDARSSTPVPDQTATPGKALPAVGVTDKGKALGLH